MSVQLLIDMNLPPAWATDFTSEGIASEHWSTVGDIRASDAIIMEWARQHDQIVLTNDLDFTTILALTHSAGPSVILLRARNLLGESLRDLVTQSIQTHEPALQRGALMIIEAGRATLRILPL